MWSTLRGLAALVLLTAPAPARPDDSIRGLLDALGAARATERAEAERRLSVALVDVARDPGRRRGFVSEASGSVDDRETARRLSVVVGGDDRLLGIAIDLVTSADPALNRVGLDAVRAQLDRWSLSAFDPPEVAAFDFGRQRFTPPKTWRDLATDEIAIDPVRGGLLGAFDRLDRFGGGLCPIVVDPRLAERAIRRPDRGLRARRITGTWLEVLEGLCSVHDAAFQVQGFRYPGESRAHDGSLPANDEERTPARVWIHVVPRGTIDLSPIGRDQRRPAGDAIVEWCIEAVRPGDVARQAAAARALAALDWAAALAWLERRWLETGDVTALEGLLAAAARGRVVPSLQRADVLRSLLGIVDADARRTLEAIAARNAALAPETVARTSATLETSSEQLDGRARRFGAGLAELGAFVVQEGGIGGPDALVALLLDGFDAAPPTGRWVRLVALEGIAAEDRRAASAAALVLRGSLDARSRRQGLRTLLAVTRPGPVAARERVALDDPGAFLAGVGPDLSGIGLELGLVGVEVAGQATRGGWVVPFADDREALAEFVLWGALVDERAPDDEAPAPWILEVARAAGRLAANPRPAFGPDPLTRAVREARGDTAATLARFVGRAAPRLGRSEGMALQRAALRAGLIGTGLIGTGLEGAAARAPWFERARAAMAAAPGDVGPAELAEAWLDAAALVADEDLGEEALRLMRESLLRSIVDGSASAGGTTMEIVAAAEAAAVRLRSARRTAAVEPFLDALREAAVGADHPVASLFLDVDWPPAPVLVPRDVERLAPPLPPR